jgi:uncharacterized protein with HEPN domain
MSAPLERPKRDLVKCEDMRLHAERARRFLACRSLEEFLADELVQSAVVRCVEVIGEAARLVSEETRLLAPGIPWPLIVGMRHVLAHDYGVVNLEKVYDVATRHLQPLIDALMPLIKALEAEANWGGTDGPPNLD